MGNQRCAYNLNDLNIYNETIYEDCTCGYNSNQQGYCKMAPSANPDHWTEYRDVSRNLLDNNCHTMNRFDCPFTDKTILMSLRKKTHDLNLFYNSVSCAKQVLSGDALKFSFFIITFIIALILG